MSKTICIITQSHLCRNPRVLKEATALAREGYEVEILTGIISVDLYQQDLAAIKAFPNIKLNIAANLSVPNLQSFTFRLLNKLGRLVIRVFKTETSLALGYGATRYYNKAKALKAGLYICHQELATYTGARLLKRGHKVAFDIEDWYSEDLLPDARAERPINLLRSAEVTALNKGLFCVTTSNALAQKLSQAYLCPPPQVIYNVFPSPGIIGNKPKEFTNPLKLFWFSQTIGPGRGLEQFLGLMASFKNKLELHLLGNIAESYRENLNSLLPKQHQLYFHNIVTEHLLAQKIAEFDIGLALEMDTPMNTNYTISNKFFQYIQSGLPVITSETAGQMEGFEQFKPGFMLPQHPAQNDINKLEQWLSNPEALKAAREKVIEMAGIFNWEVEAEKLLVLVKEALAQN